jgi:hypothetical protein
MNWVAKLPRKTRRAYDFGTAEERRAIEDKFGPRKPFYIKEVEGKIEIPVIDSHNHIMAYMMPYSGIPEKYREVARYTCPLEDGLQRIQSLDGYARFLSTWFFKGLTYLSVGLKPNVFPASISGTRAFKSYVFEILNDRSPSHEYKMAYLIYVCDMCCSVIEYEASHNC